MWDCLLCGCKAIAASLLRCPMCKEDRDVPKTTVEGGPSNADAEPGEVGYHGDEDEAAEVAEDKPVAKPAEPKPAAPAAAPAKPAEPAKAAAEPKG